MTQSRTDGASLELVLRVYVARGGVKVGGKGLVEILKAVERTGSLRGAAMAARISYRKAWAKVRYAEGRLGVRLLEGTRGRRGLKLTPEAIALVKAYERSARALSELARALGPEVHVVVEA